MTKIVGIAETAVTVEARHLAIEDGDIILITLPSDFSTEEAALAKRTCQVLRDELAAIGKTVSTVIFPQQMKLETAKRVDIKELYKRLGLALAPETGPGDRAYQGPERRSHPRKPAFDRRKTPR